MEEPIHSTASEPAPLNPGDSWGFYKIIESSASRVALRADYTMGVIMLVVGVALLLFDVLLFSNADWVTRFMRFGKNIYTFRDVLHGLPVALKGAMIVLPILGFGWFFFMTGRSITVDFTRKVARRVKFFMLSQEADLGAVAALQLRINADCTPSRGDSVSLHMLDAQGRSLFALPDETASEDEFDSTTSTDFAKLLAFTAQLASMLRVPVVRAGEPAKMSPTNRRMLDATSPRE